jgi:hypothetical protein
MCRCGRCDLQCVDVSCGVTGKSAHKCDGRGAEVLYTVSLKPLSPTSFERERVLDSVLGNARCDVRCSCNTNLPCFPRASSRYSLVVAPLFQQAILDGPVMVAQSNHGDAVDLASGITTTRLVF